MLFSSNVLLRVFEIVAQYGPVALDDAAAKGGLSRSATYRALKKLEADQWIRTRLDGRRFVITDKTEKWISSSVPAFCTVDLLVSELKRTKLARRLVVRVYQQTTTQDFRLIDSSLYFDLQNPAPMFVDQGLVLCCLRALQRAQIVVGSTRIPDFSDAELDKCLLSLFEFGHYYSSDYDLLAAPFLNETGELTIILFGQKEGSASSTLAQLDEIEVFIYDMMQKSFLTIKDNPTKISQA